MNVKTLFLHLKKYFRIIKTKIKNEIIKNKISEISFKNNLLLFSSIDSKLKKITGKLKRY